jgi:hypothetical protein
MNKMADILDYLNSQEKIREEEIKRRSERSRQRQRRREMVVKEIRWQRELVERADEKPMELWIRYYEC